MKNFIKYFLFVFFLIVSPLFYNNLWANQPVDPDTEALLKVLKNPQAREKLIKSLESSSSADKSAPKDQAQDTSNTEGSDIPTLNPDNWVPDIVSFNDSHLSKEEKKNINEIKNLHNFIVHSNWSQLISNYFDKILTEITLLSQIPYSVNYMLFLLVVILLASGYFYSILERFLKKYKDNILNMLLKNLVIFNGMSSENNLVDNADSTATTDPTDEYRKNKLITLLAKMLFIFVCILIVAIVGIILNFVICPRDVVFVSTQCLLVFYFMLLLLKLISCFIFVLEDSIKQKMVHKFNLLFYIFLYSLAITYIVGSINSFYIAEFRYVYLFKTLLVVLLFICMLSLIFTLKFSRKILKIRFKGHHSYYRSGFSSFFSNIMIFFALIISTFLITYLHYHVLVMFINKLVIFMFALLFIIIIYRLLEVVILNHIYTRSNILKNILDVSKMKPLKSILSLKKYLSTIYVMLLLLLILSLLLVIDTVFSLNLLHLLYRFIFVACRYITNFVLPVFILSIVTLGITYLINSKLINKYSLLDFKSINQTLSLVWLCSKLFYVFRFVVYIIFVLYLFNLSFTALLTSTGMLTLLIALGFKDVINSFINVVIRIVENSFSINDKVLISGQEGIVEDISLAYIRIRDLSGNLSLIPTSSIGLIVNQNDNNTPSYIEIPVSNQENYVKIENCINKAAEKMFEDVNANYILAKDKSIKIAGIVAYNVNTMIVKVGVYSQYGSAGSAKSLLLKYIQEEFIQEDIKVDIAGIL